MKRVEPRQNQGEDATRSERDLYRIMVASTALGFGTLAAFLISLRDLVKDVSFDFSVWTVLAFIHNGRCGRLGFLALRLESDPKKARGGKLNSHL